MKKQAVVQNFHITFHIDYQPIAEDSSIGIVGSCQMLGNWNNPVPMNKVGFRSWIVEFNYDVLPEYFEYKFVIFNRLTAQITLWEEGDNRIFKKAITKPNSQYRTVFRGHLDWHGAGVSIPVFSLRRKNGWGVGEFTDLCMLADWCNLTHQKLIQILPINDTNIATDDTDSYPYRSISVDALNPIYLNIEKIGKLNDADLKKEIEKRRSILNSHTKVNYSEVLKLKLKALKQIYLEQRTDDNIWRETRELLIKFERANSWLMPYAVFRSLMEDFGTYRFDTWSHYARFGHAKAKKYAEDNVEKVEFYYFVQYHLFKQLKEVKSYLNARSILLKGDLPVGVGRYSVDVWRYPNLFNTDKQAGAPPDEFSENGQNWGFPTYNWENMAKDLYRWWRERFRSMENIYDAFRIDHILGFFRIWEIPLPLKSGLSGYFNPAIPLSKTEIETYGITINSSNTLFCQNKNKSIHQTIYHEPNIDDTLFIEDPYKSFHFHPRIIAYKTNTYKKLTHEQRKNFDQLYHDYFYVRHNDFWAQSAIQKLSVMLEDSNMLVCGEDLGMLPASVPDVMRALNILSLEILRMPKELGHEFVDMSKVPYNSVFSTGTHDTSTLRMWWNENRRKTQRFYNETLKLNGNAPKLCTPDIATKIVSSLFASDAMWVILPMQDYMAIDETVAADNIDRERINYPDNPRHIWNYRLHICLEDILQKEHFNQTLKNLIINNKR